MAENSIETIRLIEEKAKAIIEKAKEETSSRLMLSHEKELESIQDLEISLQQETAEHLARVEAKTKEEATQLEESNKKAIAALAQKTIPNLAKVKAEIQKWLS
ncbi:MAG: hypothetical protein NT099_08795 [Candidatus Saganbacteria bacterium]|nr:hypothetical protein [Candidatus Saganbacteria bacterium]